VLVALHELWPRQTITIRGATLGARAFGLCVDGIEELVRTASPQRLTHLY